MKPLSSGLRLTFLIHFIVGAITGLVFLLIPEVWGNLVNWPMPEPATYRLIGAAILGYTAGSWFAYRATAWNQVRIVVQMEIVWTILGTLVLVWALLFAGLAVAAWMNAIALAAFAVAFTYFYFRDRE